MELTRQESARRSPSAGGPGEPNGPTFKDAVYETTQNGAFSLRRVVHPSNGGQIELAAISSGARRDYSVRPSSQLGAHAEERAPRFRGPCERAAVVK